MLQMQLQQLADDALATMQRPPSHVPLRSCASRHRLGDTMVGTTAITPPRSPESPAVIAAGKIAAVRLAATPQ